MTPLVALVTFHGPFGGGDLTIGVGGLVSYLNPESTCAIAEHVVPEVDTEFVVGVDSELFADETAGVSTPGGA